MAKNKKSLRLSKIRKELIYNCDEIIKLYTTMIGKAQFGEVTSHNYQQYIAGAGKNIGKAQTGGDAQNYPLDPKTVSLLLRPAHAALVQEWLIFLESVFGRIVFHYLKTKTPEKLPSRHFYFSLKKVEPSSLVNIRKSIADIAKESFSFEKYENRIKILRNIFKIKESQLDETTKADIAKMNEEMKKQVTVRNIFQHNRGQIRKTDLEEIGKKHFKMLNEKGENVTYNEGDDIILSMQEIEKLNNTIKEYSLKFEVLP